MRGRGLKWCGMRGRCIEERSMEQDDVEQEGYGMRGSSPYSSVPCEDF